ncbi:MAG: alpha/beta hydrolase [Nitrospira sp.]|nr:alpha/beta hydrolase [Nitrospira sp.]
MPSPKTTIDRVMALIVPGIGNSGAQHWQTLWERHHPSWQRVQQRDWDRPVLAEWLPVLESAVAGFPAPPVLIAHSMGCLLVAHWAQRASVPLRAALLVAPPDPQAAAFPATARGFEAVPSGRLPFPSLVVASSNDPFGSVDYAKRCAAVWGSTFAEAGAIGHINAESELGEWPAGLVLLERLLASS